jgi:hypothetical protein
MASFVGAIESFNPYIQQIPTEAYTKVGMFKEQQYEAGMSKVQDSVDKIAGLDIANEGGRQYLRARVDELSSTLNKYSHVDFSNPNNVSQLVSLSKPLYQDENIVNDVINTTIYRKWAKEASDSYKSGKMELGQYMRETTDASSWLTSGTAGAQYTGRSTPNTATKKDLIDRIIKAKKEGIEKNEYVYDIKYSTETPYYVKSTNKHYSEADFNNFVSENIMSTRDREMLMNDNWYENQGKSTEALQAEDIGMYQSKIDANNKEINRIKELPKFLSGDAKAEYEKAIDDLSSYNEKLRNGKIKFLQELNLADPTSRDVFHRDLSESRFINSLGILMDETKKEEYQKNEQWFLEKKAELDAALEAAKKAADLKAKVKTPEEAIDEVALFTPVDPNSPKTEVSLDTISRGYQKSSEEISSAMNSLIGKMQENGVDINQYIAGWDQVHVGGKAGAAMNVPRFKSEADKEKFYGLVNGLNYAYTKEAEDGRLDNHSFTDYIKRAFIGYNDEDANSKFNFADKAINDAMNSIKGTSALLPKLDKLFADKGVVRAMAQMDEALKNKKDMANAYREALYKSNALTKEEMSTLRSLTDDQLLGNNYFFDKKKESMRLPQDKSALYTYKKESDGTYSIVQNIIEDPKGDWKESNYSLLSQETVPVNLKIVDQRKLAGGFKKPGEADSAFKDEGQLSLSAGISKESFRKADEFVKKTYSYVQENLNSTVQNLKGNKDDYAAVQDGLAVFLTRSRLQATPEDVQIDGVDNPASITGIKDVEVRAATIGNAEDIFNPNPMYEVSFTASVPSGEKGELKPTQLTGRVSIKSFLATNPNYRTSKYAQYFAPMMYAQQDAYTRIKSNINPLEGSEASYAPRADIDPVYNRTNYDGKQVFATDQDTRYQWHTIPIEKDNRQTMVSYQVVSLGQNTVLGNAKNKDGNTYAPGAFYVKMRIPTVNGAPKQIFFKKPSGDSYVFNSASNAHYVMRDLIFNNPDIKFDEVDQKTGQANYFTTDPTTLRGIFNAQLSYNGYSKLELIKIKDALGKEIQKQQAKELQFGTEQR